jgi:lysophospholipase L1-like esterase
MRQHPVRNLLLRWGPVMVGLAVLTGCVAVPATRALTRSSEGAAITRTEVLAHRRGQHVLFMGASYTAGLGAVPNTNGYAYLTGAKLRWPTQVHGMSGTGYLNPGPHHQGTFAQQIARMPKSFAPSLLVLQGGRNDGAYPQAALEKAVDNTIRLAHAHFRQATLVLLGPIPPRTPVDRAELKVEAAIGHVAHSDHVDFIDPIHEHWITAHNAKGYIGRVANHPNNAGYAYIADRLTADIDHLLHLPPAGPVRVPSVPGPSLSTTTVPATTISRVGSSVHPA